MSARGLAVDRPPVELLPTWESRHGPTGQLWGLSRVNGREHEVDPGGEHPALVYLARCGHRLLRRTILREVPPGRRCPACVGGAGR
jgi:hypothetical protein